MVFLLGNRGIMRVGGRRLKEEYSTAQIGDKKDREPRMAPCSFIHLDMLFRGM